MIIWLNGTFGAGKTTTARELVATTPGARLFDPELVGYLLRAILPDTVWRSSTFITSPATWPPGTG
jgi:adenylate kinase family enzyme